MPQFSLKSDSTHRERARRNGAKASPPVTTSLASAEVATVKVPVKGKLPIIPQGDAVPSKGLRPQSARAGQPRAQLSHQAPSWKTSWMFRETTELPVRTIKATTLEPDGTKVSSERGFETLCSYNWQCDGSIYVPGAPPRWNPPPLPTTLAQDSGRHFVDQNASRVPKYPFEPAFAALAVMGPDVVLDRVDIIANRNSLRKLLDFSAGRKLDIFCMGLHMVGNTLVISRKERNAQQMIHGAPNAGYGHNFEKTFTMPDHGMGNSSSHHRVIRYYIGPLNCVVRFEVDAYYDDPDVVLDSKFKQPRDEPVGTVSAAMAQLNIAGLPSTQTKPRKTPVDKPTLVVEKGIFINPSKLAEIKAKKLARLTEALPQLWFGRTPYFMNGNHDKGTVHSVSISDAEKEYPRWEEANQDKLRKMVSVLAELRDAVTRTKERAAVLVYDEKGGPLKVYAMKKNHGVLPSETIAKHWTNAGGNAG